MPMSKSYRRNSRLPRRADFHPRKAAVWEASQARRPVRPVSSPARNAVRVLRPPRNSADDAATQLSGPSLPKLAPAQKRLREKLNLRQVRVQDQTALFAVPVVAPAKFRV